MAGLSLGGLASGMDTDAVISKLMAIEAQGKNRLLAAQYRAEARRNAVDQIATKLRSLKTATEDLKSVTSWQTVQTVTSSDAARVGATYKAGAAVGVYAIEVTQLARAEQRFYTYATNPAATTISIQLGSEAAVNVDIPAGADAAAAAAAINAKTEVGAYASVVDGQLVLSGKKTGLALTVSGTQLTEDAAKLRAARPAKYTIDGGPELTSTSNTVTGLTGVDLTLKGLTTTTGPVMVEVGAPGPDLAQMKAKVKAFVDAYNSTIDLVRGKLEEQVVRNPATMADYGKGALRGDAGLNAVLSNLRQAMSETFTGPAGDPNLAAYDTLAEIGISVPSAQTSGSVSADRLAGKLVIDDEKLTAALTNDPLSVRRLLGGVSGVDGAAQRITGILDPMARSGDGALAERSEMITREITRIKDQQAAMDRRLELKEKRLRAQFTAMETALNSTQSTTSWLTGQIGSLPSWSAGSS